MELIQISENTLKESINTIIYYYLACYDELYPQPINIDEIEIPISLFTKTTLLVIYNSGYITHEQEIIDYQFAKEMVKRYFRPKDINWQVGSFRKYIPCQLIIDERGILYVRSLWIYECIVPYEEKKWFAFLTLKLPYYNKFEKDHYLFKKLLKKYLEQGKADGKIDWTKITADDNKKIIEFIFLKWREILLKYSQYWFPTRESYKFGSFKLDEFNTIAEYIMTYIARDMRCA